MFIWAVFLSLILSSSQCCRNLPMASFFLSSSTFLPLPSSYKLFLSLHHDYSPHLSFNNFQYPLRKHFTFTLCASSLNKSSRFDCLKFLLFIKKKNINWRFNWVCGWWFRSRRKVKSNEELRNDLREFLSGVGLPNDHVPTMKELLEHGRLFFLQLFFYWCLLFPFFYFVHVETDKGNS